MWKDIAVFGIPGYLALIASAIVLWQDIRRYRLSLRVRVSQARVLWYKDNVSIVLFRLMFVNPASRGKTVNNVKLHPPPVINDKQYPFVYCEDLQYVKCPLPNVDKPEKFLFEQILEFPLDIPPHQSRWGWYSKYLEIPPSEQAGIWETVPVPFQFYVFDIDDKQIAKCEVQLTLNQLRNPDIYLSTAFVKVKP
jgi:hypothetical protein